MLFIKNGHIRTMAGPDIENGCILIGDDGKIISVGNDILPPDGAQIIDAEGHLVTPGCVEAQPLLDRLLGYNRFAILRPSCV